MTSISGTMRERRRPGGVDLVDVSCGSCEHCSRGVDFWCAAPRGEESGVVLAALDDLPDEGILMTLLGLSSLSSRASVATPVLIETSDAETAGRLAAVLLPVDALATADSRSPETRARLSELSRTGRAATVLNARDQGKAVRAVERGGTVVLVTGEGPQPTLTEIVQRELTVIGVDSLAPLRGVGVDRLSAVLAGEEVA